MDPWVVILAALAPSVLTLVYTMAGMKHKAEVDYVERLEQRLDKAEERLTECESDREKLFEKVRKLEAKPHK